MWKIPFIIGLLLTSCFWYIMIFSTDPIHTHIQLPNKNQKSNVHRQHRKVLSSSYDNDNYDISSLISGTRDDVHFVVTTGCSGYQNWQFETLIYSWSIISQPGRFTRIIAGCKNDNERFLANRTAIPNDNNRILFYFVSDFSPDKDTAGSRPFWYFNKPFGFNQWLFDDNNNIYESVIILIDPDMIILKPFLFHIKLEADKIANQLLKTSPEKTKLRDLWVRKGHPVSQKYGIGAKWIKWNGFCDDPHIYNNTDCYSINDRSAWNYYSVGPPYMMHISDWKLITPKWIEFSPRALELDPPPSILAEMYSYSIACSLYNLKHEYLLSMISHPDSNEYMENSYDLDFNIFNNNNNELIINSNNFKFHILHYCHGYWLGKNRNEGTIRNGGWNFHKGHIPVNYLYDCDIPLLVQPEITNIYKNRDASKHENQYGMVWILNVLLRRINDAVLNYRIKYCKNNWKPEYKLVLQQPEADRSSRRMNYILNQYDNGISWKGA